MRLFQKVKHWKFSKSRIEAFSDGVFAIVITLLVLEIKVPAASLPHPVTADKLWMALRELSPKILSWLISFFFVAIMWLQHHNILRMASMADYGVLWLNNFVLMAITFFPFPTALLGEYPSQPQVVMLWGLCTAITTLFLALLYRYNTRHYLRDTYNRKKVDRNVRLSFVAGPLLYTIAALLALLSIKVAYVLYALVPVLYLLPLDKEESEHIPTEPAERD